MFGKTLSGLFGVRAAGAVVTAQYLRAAAPQAAAKHRAAAATDASVDRGHT